MPTTRAIYLTSLLAALAAAGALAITAANRVQQPATQSDSPKTPVVVELFTSEGCSSCPPADALLKQLSQEQPVRGAEVIALEEHVDYWNQLGWTDPYSSRDFSARQEEYASNFRNGGVYTPQMIVDGATELVGSRRSDADAAIQREAATPKIKLTLNQTSEPGKKPVMFEAHVGDVPASLGAAKLELWIAATEKGLQTSVNAGENSGETLQHADVVRTLRKAQSLHSESNTTTTVSVDLKENWKLANVRVVAFLVDKTSHHIVGSVSVTPRT
jgi:hypothetical protein